jgi:hypothetical protein
MTRKEYCGCDAASWGGAKGEKDSEAPKLKGARWFSFDEIKKITNNFHEDNEIGVGGYGKVRVSHTHISKDNQG